MSTKWKKTKQTENKGLIVVADIINNSNCILNKIDGSNDIGLDGYLEFVEKESTTGFCVGIQVKSGGSYQTSNRKFALLKSDKAHFEYRKNHSLPVVGIVYIPEDEKAYWIDIAEYLSFNANIILDGPYDIKISKNQIFDEKTFPEFYKNLLSRKKIFESEANFARTLKGIINSKPSYERVDAFKSLFSFYRDSQEAWYFVILQFIKENDEYIQKLIIYWLGRIVGHGDIFWHSNNMIDELVRKYVKNIIIDFYGISEVIKLINNIDDAGISRGAMGQNIYPLIKLITRDVEVFKKIILDKKSTEHVRLWAGVFVIDELQHYDLERAINFANSMVINFHDSENKSMFIEIKLTLEEHRYVDFHG